MQERNPELFKAMNEMINYQERMEVDTIAESKRASRNQKETMVPNAAQESFLTMGEM
jgi:aromatic ring hydroxylase